MQIMVVDGQGGGVGRLLVQELRAAFEDATILAIGANAVATANMLKAGASGGASGENAICLNAARADVIVAPIGAYLANAMLGEITPAMAAALSTSRALRIAIPVSRCCVQVVGVQELPMKELIARAVERIQEHAPA